MNALTLPEFEEPDVQEPQFIDVDMPFDAEEVERATCRKYVEQLTRSDMPIVAATCRQSECPVRERRAALATEHVFDPIDVDLPFSAAEVAMLTSPAYVAALGRSDMPVAGRWGQFASR